MDFDVQVGFGYSIVRKKNIENYYLQSVNCKRRDLMILCPPKIEGPVSECSSAVIVQGQLTGSTVQVILNGDLTNPLCHGVASYCRQVYGFPAGSLKAGDCLTAIQSKGADTSAESPEYVTVQKFDAAGLAVSIFASHLFVCGRYLLVNGAIPGAAIEIRSGTGTPQTIVGTGSSLVGFSFIGINPPFGLHKIIAARQTACNTTGPDVTGPMPDQPPVINRQLPVPFITAPLYGCDTHVLVEGIVPGADVTLHRNGSTESTAGTPFNSIWMPTKSPLIEGYDKLTASQEMIMCGYTSGESLIPQIVKPYTDIPAPIIADTGPLCAGTTGISVSNLRPGAMVRILQDGTEIGVGQTPDASFTFYVGPLPDGALITAQQSLCDFWSPESNAVKTRKAPKKIITARIAIDPLYECITSVPVTRARPGSWIRVMSKKLGQISSPTYVTTHDSIIPVSPALQVKDEIFLEQFLCGKSPVHSTSVSVGQLPSLGKPQIVTPVNAGQQQVTVKNVTPMAVVEIYLNGKYQAAGTGPGNTVTINLGVKLKTGDKLNARQQICNKVTTIDWDKLVRATTPDINTWLHDHPALSDYIVWEDSKGPHAWNSWSPARKTELFQAFELAINQSSIPVNEVPPNKKVLADNDDVDTILAQSDAWAYFKASVAQSLAFELEGQFQWSLLHYTPEQLAQILDSREMFTWMASSAGYEIEFKHGAVVPAPPAYSYEFLLKNHLMGISRPDTMALVIDWCRSNLYHLSHGWETSNMEDQWQYRGFPPLFRVLEGTKWTSEPLNGTRHRTAGCWGTVGLLRSLLRAVNIPVKLVEIVDPGTPPADPPSAHALPWFMADAKYLSHGDDPYSVWCKKSVPLVPASEYFIDQSVFDAWFGASVSDADKSKNIGRQPVELGIKYLSNYLLTQYCKDIAAHKNHADGVVFALLSKYYTLDQLEAQDLWTRMDTKLAVFGGCSGIPSF